MSVRPAARRRDRCSRCGKRCFRYDNGGGRRRWLAAHMTGSRVAELLRITWRSVQAIVIRVVAKRAYGFHSPDALLGQAMLTRGGCCPPLPGRP